MKTSIHQHVELESYSIGNVEPVELVVQYSRQSTIVLPSVTNQLSIVVIVIVVNSCQALLVKLQH